MPARRMVPAPFRHERIRGRLLQTIRRRHLEEQPLCVACLARGRVELATQVDHMQALAHGGTESRDPFHNRQGLCDECHKSKTCEEFGKQRKVIGLDGWPCEPGG